MYMYELLLLKLLLLVSCKGSLKKKKKHLDGLSPQWGGGGFRAESTFAQWWKKNIVHF